MEKEELEGLNQALKKVLDTFNENKELKQKLQIAIDALCHIENATDAYAIQQENKTINKAAWDALGKIGAR